MKISLNLYTSPRQAFGKNKTNKAKTNDLAEKTHSPAVSQNLGHTGLKKHSSMPDNTMMSAYGIHPANTVYGWKEIKITKPKEEDAFALPLIKAKEPALPIKPDPDFDGPGKVAHKFKSPQTFIKYHLDSLTEVSREVSDIYDSGERHREKSRSYHDLIYNGINWLNMSDLCTLPKSRKLSNEEKLYIALLYSYFSQNYEGGPVNGYERPPFIKSVKQSMDDAVKKEDTCSYLHHFLFNIQYLLPSEIYNKVEDEYDFEIKEGARISAENERYYEYQRDNKPGVFDYMDYYGY